MSWRDVKAHFGRRFVTKGKSSAEVEDLLKSRRETAEKAAKDMEIYTNKDKWEEHLKKKVKDKMNDSWKKKSEGIGDRGYNDV